METPVDLELYVDNDHNNDDDNEETNYLIPYACMWDPLSFGKAVGSTRTNQAIAWPFFRWSFGKGRQSYKRASVIARIISKNMTLEKAFLDTSEMNFVKASVLCVLHPSPVAVHVVIWSQ